MSSHLQNLFVQLAEIKTQLAEVESRLVRVESRIVQLMNHFNIKPKGAISKRKTQGERK